MQKCQFPGWKDTPSHVHTIHRVGSGCGRDLLMPLSLVLWELDGGGSVVLERGISYATGVFLGVQRVWLASLWGAGVCQHLDLAVVCCCCGVGPLPVMCLILGCCAPLTVWCLCGLWLYSSLPPWGPVPSWQERGGLLASPVCCRSTSEGLGKDLLAGCRGLVVPCPSVGLPWLGFLCVHLVDRYVIISGTWSLGFFMLLGIVGCSPCQLSTTTTNKPSHTNAEYITYIITPTCSMITNNNVILVKVTLGMAHL